MSSTAERDPRKDGPADVETAFLDVLEKWPVMKNHAACRLGKAETAAIIHLKLK